METIRLHCEEGFHLSGSHKLTCKGNEEWDKPMPTCVEQLCSAPPKIKHATLLTENVTKDGLAVYQCMPGFKRQGGDSVRHCSQNGLLLGHDIKCSCKMIFIIDYLPKDGLG